MQSEEIVELLRTVHNQANIGLLIIEANRLELIYTLLENLFETAQQLMDICKE